MFEYPIDAEIARKILEYDPISGVFTWKFRDDILFCGTSSCPRELIAKRWNSRCCGKQAFTSLDSRGYRQSKIFNKTYTAHRVAFLLMLGRYPNHVDHINRDRSDCRWANLRDVSNRDNCTNRSKQSNNTSGVTGVFWVKNMKKWRAEIKVNGVVHNLGYFYDLEKAREKRNIALLEHGFSPTHGA